MFCAKSDTRMAATRKRKSPSSLRDRFIRSVAAESSYHALFEHIAGVAFFMKDRKSRLIAANRHFYERLGFQSERGLIGKDDFALFPARLAEHFRRDDAEAMRTGTPKLNIIELFFNRQGIPDWFLTHKLPVRRTSVSSRRKCSASRTGKRSRSSLPMSSRSLRKPRRS